MTDTSAATAYRNLEPDQIIDSLTALGFRCDGRFLALNSYENRVYQIGIEDESPIVAKFYRPARWSDEAIREEHEFTAELAAQEIPVVPPLQLNDSTLHSVGPFRLAVYPCRGGRAPELDNFELLKQLGRLLARIHLVGETASFSHRPEINIESYGDESYEFLMDSDFIPEELLDAYESIAELVLEGAEHCFERAGPFGTLRLHADFHPGNVLVLDDALHIVDFDDARTGPAVQDLWMFLSGDQQEQSPQLAAILEGYTEFRSFDSRELHLVEALRSLRIMHYSAWIARRWDDPAFKIAFPWFDSQRYWEDHILSLKEQVALMQDPPLQWHGRQGL